MIAIYEALGAKPAKVHITYRYLLNPKLSFIRFRDELSDKQQYKGANRGIDQ